jgi:hypothetical protein
MQAWIAAGQPVATTELAAPGAVTGRVLDIRQDSEYAAGHLPQAVHLELGDLARNAAEAPNGPVTVMCALLAGIIADLAGIRAATWTIAALTAVSGILVAARMYETHRTDSRSLYVKLPQHEQFAGLVPAEEPQILMEFAVHWRKSLRRIDKGAR